MLERTVSLKIEEAYQKLRTTFVDNGCRVLHEVPPNRISWKQGSLWGLMPNTAKKSVEIILEPTRDGTLVRCYSQLSSDWKNITLIGCVFAFALVAFCVWLASDLSTVLVSAQDSFWSWLVSVDGIVNSKVGVTFVNLVWGLAAFLSVVILAEIVIFIHAKSKIDSFAAEVLEKDR